MNTYRHANPDNAAAVAQVILTEGYPAQVDGDRVLTDAPLFVVLAAWRATGRGSMELVTHAQDYPIY